MNLNEDSATGSSFYEGVRSMRPFDGEFAPGLCLRLNSEENLQKEAPAANMDWGCEKISVNSSERLEQERLEKVERELIGRVIEAYECAVQNGLAPNRAIAGLLEWASLECPRLLP